jgi:excinuclease UvrABC nuclease subunit
VAIAHLLEHPGTVDALVLLAPAIEVSSARSPLLATRAWHEIARRLLPFTRVVYSPFENDFWFLTIARRVYPDSYRGLIRPRRCWMIHGDAADEFPRLARTAEFEPLAGARVGPVADKHSAQRLVEFLIDLFDLCRYHHILIQAPHGDPCAYKEMGRCPAPCDGSASMADYRRDLADALRFASDADFRATWNAARQQDMAGAAERLDFESAGRIRNQLERAAAFDSPKYCWLRDVEQLDFLVVQPGPRKAELRSFRTFGGRIRPGPAIERAAPAKGLAAWMRLKPPPPELTIRAEEAALLADYLFKAERDRGLFVPFHGQATDDLAAAVTEAFPPTRRRKTSPKASK